VDHLGANLWGHSEEGKTASIRAGRIQSSLVARAGTMPPIGDGPDECRDSIGHPFWNPDFCEVQAARLLEKARAAGTTIFD
jgi:hypothetical protein